MQSNIILDEVNKMTRLTGQEQDKVLSFIKAVASPSYVDEIHAREWREKARQILIDIEA